jgi:hypothetical protein
MYGQFSYLAQKPVMLNLYRSQFFWQFDVMVQITVASPCAPTFHEVLADDFAFLVRLLVGLVWSLLGKLPPPSLLSSS